MWLPLVPAAAAEWLAVARKISLPVEAGLCILWVYGRDEPEADTGITGDLAMSKRELYYELRRGGMGRETARACVVETSLMGRLDRLDYWLTKLQERTSQ